MNNDAMRAAFEAWFGAPRPLTRGADGHYKHLMSAFAAFAAWQAATMAERERCALVCEELQYTDNDTPQACARVIRSGK
jgi:hypothetical protein